MGVVYPFAYLDSELIYLFLVIAIMSLDMNAFQSNLYSAFFSLIGLQWVKSARIKMVTLVFIKTDNCYSSFLC